MNEAIESLTEISCRLQEKIWRSPERKKYGVSFIADMLLVDRTTSEAIGFGRRLANCQPNDYYQGDESIEFFIFCRFLRRACRYYNGNNSFNGGV